MSQRGSSTHRRPPPSWTCWWPRSSGWAPPLGSSATIGLYDSDSTGCCRCGTAAWPRPRSRLRSIRGVLSYTLRDLWRNPRRTLASLAGVVLAVGLFSGIAFFVDSSAATMTAHALAPVALDMQVDLSAPLASPLNVTQTPVTAGPLAAGETSVVRLVVTNTSSRPATGIVVRDQPPQGLIYVPGTTAVAGGPVADTAGGSPLLSGLVIGDLAANGQATLTYTVKATAAVPSTLALPFAATVVSKEQPAPSTANAPSAPNADTLLRDIKGADSPHP